MGRWKSRTGLQWITAIAVVLLALSCGPKVQQPMSQLDTPEHHTFTADKLLTQEKWAEAEAQYGLALRLDPRYAKAHVGQALAKAYQGNLAAALESLDQADKHARSDDEKLSSLVGHIRVYTLSRAACLKIGVECKADEGWLTSAKGAFDRALLIHPKSAVAHYYMGEGYLTALDLDRSGQMFRRVLELNTEYVSEADQRWKMVQKIQRAMPGSAAGKKIALAERLTRADAAALFMEELKIDILYQKRTPQRFDTAFKDPGQARGTAAGAAVPGDIAAHPLRADIEALLKTGARGLEVYPDGSFRPDEPVDRASYAMMIEDILIRVSGDQALATRFIGNRSPFPDLRPDLPYFNAAMVVTSRGIMEVRNMMTGEFAPLEAVGGADALLAIRKIRDELRY